MKIAVWGSLILAAMIAGGFGGYPGALKRSYPRTAGAADVRADIHRAELQVHTERDREILREFEQIVDLADNLTSGESHDRLMRDIGAAIEQAKTEEAVIRIRGQATNVAKLDREPHSELRLPPRPARQVPLH